MSDIKLKQPKKNFDDMKSEQETKDKRASIKAYALTNGFVSFNQPSGMDCLYRTLPDGRRIRLNFQEKVLRLETKMSTTPEQQIKQTQIRSYWAVIEEAEYNLVEIEDDNLVFNKKKQRAKRKRERG